MSHLKFFCPICAIRGNVVFRRVYEAYKEFPIDHAGNISDESYGVDLAKEIGAYACCNACGSRFTRVPENELIELVDGDEDITMVLDIRLRGEDS